MRTSMRHRGVVNTLRRLHIFSQRRRRLLMMVVPILCCMVVFLVRRTPTINLLASEVVEHSRAHDAIVAPSFKSRAGHSQHVNKESSSITKPARRSTKCKFGELDGHWESHDAPHHEWHPHVLSDSNCHFKQYLQDGFADTFATHFRGKSIYLIGDSLDRYAITYFCGRYAYFGVEPYVLPWRSETPGVHFWYCKTENFTIGFFHNVGILDPPFYVAAYKDQKHEAGLCCNLSEDLDVRIARDAGGFRDAVLGGADPTLVVVQSHLWDLANPSWRNDDEYISFWFARAQRFVELVQQTFPTAHVAWRHSAPVLTWGVDPRIDSLRKMDRLVQSAAEKLHIDIIDYHKILEGDGPEKEYLEKDIHPWFSGRAALINVACNILADWLGWSHVDSNATDAML